MKILDLGCGTKEQKYKSKNPRDIVIGLDKYQIDGTVDVVADVEKGLPFKDMSFDMVVSNYMLEQITNLDFLMKEVHRILKSGGLFKIKVAFYTGWAQYNDPLHVRHFTYYSFDRYEPDHVRKYRDEYKPNFRIRKKRIIFGVGVTKILNPIVNPLVNKFHRFYSRFLAWTLPCVDVHFELEVIK